MSLDVHKEISHAMAIDLQNQIDRELSGNGVIRPCPACGRQSAELVNGVCARCKKNFQIAHGKKLNTEWKPSDFRYGCEKIPLENFVVMDQDDAHRSQELSAMRETRDFFKRGYRLLVQYRGNRVMAEHAYALAHGWGDLIGCETAVDVAVKLFKNPKKKAAVSKLECFFRDAMNIPAMGGKRNEKGREKMAQARNGQLKKL